MTVARLLLASVLLVAGLSTAQAEPGLFNLLVGTYTNGASQGLYVYRFNSRNGQVDGPLRIVKASNPSFITLSRDGRTLFTVNENGRGTPGDSIGRVTSYRFEPGNGRLQQISQVKTLGDEPTYSSLSADGKYLFVANYASQPEGSLAVLPVQDNGVLSPVAQIEFHQPSEQHPRQQSSHIHAAVVSPDGRQVFAPDLGADRVFVYRYRPDQPERPLVAADPAFVPVPAGSGPRHLVFSADGSYAYLTLELAGQVMAFANQDGQLRQLQTYSLTPQEFVGERDAGALHLSGDGRFLYVASRGDDNQLVVFAVNPDGTLSFVERHPVSGVAPREFALDPSGRFLLVANQQSNQLKVFARDPDSGRLGEELQSLDVGAPADLKFVAVP